MNQLEKLLGEYIKQKRELHKDEPFLSDYENGVNEGVNTAIDDIEEIIKSISSQSEE